jgi:hypothetical protein
LVFLATALLQKKVEPEGGGTAEYAMGPFTRAVASVALVCVLVFKVANRAL